MRFLTVFTFIAFAGFATAQQPFIPFQGHLTVPSEADPNVYEPVPAGQYDVLFTLYTAPAGGESKVWGPERHENVTVVNGLVNAIIGSVEELPEDDPAFFARPLYVGITIDADGNPSTPDLELVPRQVWLPELYAAQAGNAEHADRAEYADDAGLLQGQSWSDLLAPPVNDLREEGARIRSTFLPPDASILGGLTLEDGLSEGEALLKAVELSAEDNALKLSYDVPGQEETRFRGFYLGGGKVQVAGNLSAFQNLTPGASYFLSDSSASAGELILRQGAPDRQFATLMGIATSETNLYVSPRRQQLLDTIILEEDKGNLLTNPDFENGTTGWEAVGSFSGPIDFRTCNGSFTMEGREAGNSVLTYQIVDIPQYLWELVDSGGLQVNYGARMFFYVDNDSALTVLFLDNAGANSLGQTQFFVNYPGGERTLCDEIQQSGLRDITPGTRALRLELRTRTGAQNIYYDDVILQLAVKQPQ